MKVDHQSSLANQTHSQDPAIERPLDPLASLFVHHNLRFSLALVHIEFRMLYMDGSPFITFSHLVFWFAGKTFHIPDAGSESFI